MPEMKMDEEKSLSYAAGELKRSHLTAAILLCDPRDIYKVMDQVRYKKIKNPMLLMGQVFAISSRRLSKGAFGIYL